MTVLNKQKIATSLEANGLHQEPVVMVPYLKNRADAVDGHYCIARLHPQGYHEFWNDKQKKWCPAGSVFELGKAP